MMFIKLCPVAKTGFGPEPVYSYLGYAKLVHVDTIKEIDFVSEVPFHGEDAVRENCTLITYRDGVEEMFNEDFDEVVAALNKARCVIDPQPKSPHEIDAPMLTMPTQSEFIEFLMRSNEHRQNTIDQLKREA